MDTISIPVKLQGGSLKMHEEGSDQYYAHLLTFALQTEKGELILNPEFGVLDPVFDDDLTFELAFTAAQYIPEITVGGVGTVPDADGRVSLQIIFERN